MRDYADNHRFYGTDLIPLVIEKYGKRDIIAYGDPDVDGCMAWRALADYLELKGLRYSSLINNNRKHGILHEGLTNKLIFNVDSNVPMERLKELVDAGNVVVSIDHHEVVETEEETKAYLLGYKLRKGFIYYENLETKTLGFVINNQYSFEPDRFRFMSGCGVTLQVFKQLEPKYYKNEHTAWHGITLLSDIRNIENNYARKILEFTFNYEIESETVLAHLIEQVGWSPFAVGKPMLDRSYIDYHFNPILNAFFRFDMGDKVLMALRFNTLKGAKTIRDKQSLVIKELMERTKRIKFKNMELLILEKLSTDMFDASNFIGYVANKFLKDGFSQIILCTEANQFIRGSFRGLHPSLDYRSQFKALGIQAEGHPSAFGLLSFTADKLTLLKLDRAIGELEANYKSPIKVYTYSKLSRAKSKILELAYENQFLLSANANCVRYTGLYSVFRETAGLIEYKADGITLTAFDKSLNPSNAYIVPTVSNNFNSLILNKAIDRE